MGENASPNCLRDTIMNFSETSPRLIEGHLKEKVLLIFQPNLGKTTVLPVLPVLPVAAPHDRQQKSERRQTNVFFRDIIILLRKQV